MSAHINIEKKKTKRAQTKTLAYYDKKKPSISKTVSFCLTQLNELKITIDWGY